MAFKPQEVAEITVNGMRYRDWESVTVKLAEGESNNTFRLTVSEGKPLRSRWADMQIRPGDHCSITLAGELAITGYVETRQVAYTGEQHGIEIIGVSYTKATADGAAMTETQEFRKKPFQQIAQDTLKPFGIQFKPMSALPNQPFHRASIAPGQSAWDFLESLARQRGITLGTDTEGNMTGRTTWMGGGAMLIEGINILEGREVMTINQGGGPNYADSQHGGTNENFGPKVAHDPTANTKANVNTGGKGVYAPNKQLAEQPGMKEDVQQRSEFESQQRGAEQLQVTIVVQGWLKPGGGGLWKPGEKVYVKSPMLIVDEMLDLVSATFTQDDKKGTRTTLELKRPGGEGDQGTGGSGEDFSSKTDGSSSSSSGESRSPSLGE